MRNFLMNKRSKANYCFFKALTFLICFSASLHLTGQESDKMAMMRDTLDGKLGFSSFLIDAHGFVPVPMIITEPAIGGFGIRAEPLLL